MRKILLGLIVMAFFYGCGPKGYNVQGTIDKDEMNGYMVYLADRDGRDWTLLDSALIENGKFEMSGTVDSLRIAYILLGQAGEIEAAQAFVYENANIQVDLVSESIKVKGSLQNDLLTQYFANVENPEIRMTEIRNTLMENPEMSEEEKESLKSEYNDLIKQVEKTNLEFAKSNINTLGGAFVFKTSYYNMSLEEKEEIIALMNDETKKDERIAKIVKSVEAEKNVAIGNKFIDIKLQGTDGNDISLSDYVGKTDYLLIDFWASWCGPCIRSFPELTKTYEKYKDGRFEIFGVSLDNDGDAWKEAIEKYQLNWIHVSDLKRWDSAAAELYAVNFIPTTVLLDKEGIIIGRNLSKEELNEILANKE